MAYVTRTYVKTANSIPAADTSQDDLIDQYITAVQAWIDNYCHRTFETTTATKLHDYKRSDILWLRDDLYSLTTFTNGDSEVLTENTHFYLRPYGGPPYQWVEMEPTSGKLLQYTTTPLRAISVAGDWGFSETAPAIIQAAAAAWIGSLVSQASLSGVASMSMAGYSVSFRGPDAERPCEPPATVAQMLKPYIRRRPRGFMP